jgi:hypothetical protein
VAVSELKPPLGSRSCLKCPLELLETRKLYIYIYIYIIVFKADAMGVVIEICIKHPRGKLE